MLINNIAKWIAVHSPSNQRQRLISEAVKAEASPMGSPRMEDHPANFHGAVVSVVQWLDVCGE